MRQSLLVIAVASSAIAPECAFANAVDDHTTAQNIGSVIRDGGELQDYRIGVNCKNGIATLVGTVKSVEQMNLAIGIARETKSVVKVINKLKVGPPAKNSAITSTAINKVVRPLDSGMPSKRFTPPFTPQWKRRLSQTDDSGD